MDQVGQTQEPIFITKRGQIVAQLTPPAATAKKPWLALRGSVKIKGDLLKPVLSDKEILSHLAGEAKRIRGSSH